MKKEIFTSIEIAEMLGISHKDLLRIISHQTMKLKDEGVSFLQYWKARHSEEKGNYIEINELGLEVLRERGAIPERNKFIKKFKKNSKKKEGSLGMEGIVVTGTQEFLGSEIPVIEGGFGEGQKVILAKTIAEIHGISLKRVNELIKNNLDEFEEGVDIMDLKDNKKFEVVAKDHELYSQNALNRSSNIYLLSERGYLTLAMLMKTDKAKQIRKKLLDEYFIMRKVISSSKRLKAELLLAIYNGGEEGLEASKKLAELEKAPLLEEIEEQKPIVEYHNEVLNPTGLVTVTDIAKDLGMNARKLNSLLHDKGVIFKSNGNWKPYSEYEWLIPDYADYNITKYGQNLKWTEKGRKFIIGLLNK